MADTELVSTGRDAHEPVADLFAGLLWIVVTMIPVTLLHELGHAIAARRLLDTPVDVEVGSVGEFARLQLGEISVSLNVLDSLTGASESATFDASRARARDVLVIALAGPAASAIGLLASKAALDTLPAHGVMHDLLWAMTLAGSFAVLNLIPFTVRNRRDGPTHHSDGRLALDAARALHALR